MWVKLEAGNRKQETGNKQQLLRLDNIYLTTKDTEYHGVSLCKIRPSLTARPHDCKTSDLQDLQDCKTLGQSVLIIFVTEFPDQSEFSIHVPNT